MSVATFRVPYMAILAIFFVTMVVRPANAAIGYDCNTKRNYTVTVSFASIMSETEILRSKFFATFHPDEFAYQWMRSLGYNVVTEEDKFHIIQCVPVIVVMQPQDKCYDRLPILKGGQKLFLTPWTHIITNHANEIVCDTPLLQEYELEAKTYKVLPRPVYSIEPKKLKRDTKKTKFPWQLDIGNIMTAGIYSEKDIQAKFDLMSSPNKINPPPPTVNVANPNRNKPNVIIYENRDPHHLECVSVPSSNTYFIIAIVAVVTVGILVCGCIIKMVIDKINHGSALHSVNGICMRKRNIIASNGNHI